MPRHLGTVETSRVVAQLAAFIGVGAGFWHIWWVAGVGIVAAGTVGVMVHSAGYVRLERDLGPAAEDGQAPGDAVS
jgi:hypothetical protein